MERQTSSRVAHLVVCKFFRQSGIIKKPYGRLLDHGDSAKLYAQATYDVAVALQLCADRCTAHRDVTSNNIIVYKGRGVLCDFSAAKVSEECATLPWCIKYAYCSSQH